MLELPLDPLFNQQHRADAWRLLQEYPRGSFRGWAARLGWTVSATYDFVKNLEKRGYVVVRSSPAYGSTLQFQVRLDPPRAAKTRSELLGEHAQNTVPTDPKHSPDTVMTRDEPLENSEEIELESREAKPSLRDAAEDVIRVMNKGCRGRFSDFVPVQLDQHGSHRAVAELLALGVPLDFVHKRLWRDIQALDPSRAGGGRLPGSVAFFVKGIKRAWLAELRDRQRREEESAAERREERQRSTDRPARPHAIGEIIQGLNVLTR